MKVADNTPQIRFDRSELNHILPLYGRMVAAGEWRDYAMDFLEDRAVFYAYRRSSEVALYSIVKQPRLKAKQGQYAVITATCLILKRGNELVNVLRVFDKTLFRALSV